MKSIKQQRLEFLKDTVEYYSQDTSKRAVKNNDVFCMYYDPATGNKCAIGRHINEQDYKNNDIDSGYTISSYKVFALLPENVRRLGQEFLEVVQRLHDDKSNWIDGIGLSNKGKKFVESIIAGYCK